MTKRGDKKNEHRQQNTPYLKQQTLAIISLGCAKNLTLSEEIAARFGVSGFALTPEPTGADLVILNTCGFIGDAREETFETVKELSKLRKKGLIGVLVVYGCMVQGFLDELQPRFPDVDLWIGATTPDRLYSLVIKQTRGAWLQVAWDKISGNPSPRLYLTPMSYAYLKLSDGCDNRCAYCSIPRLRGNLRSYPRSAILREAKQIVASGRPEIILIAQDLAAYGADKGLSELAQIVPRICDTEGLEWLRLLYLHPAHITDEIVALYKNEPLLVPYIDLPVQHLDDKVLKDMGRRTTYSSIAATVKKLRKACPDIAIRTSILTGFPTEGEKEFDTMMKRLNEIGFTHVGVFTYSPEPHTPAFELEDAVPEEVKRQRADAVMELAKRRSIERNASRVGQTEDVLIDGWFKENDEFVSFGRTEFEAPEVDGQIFVPGKLEVGQFYSVEFTEALDYDLVGKLVDTP